MHLPRVFKVWKIREIDVYRPRPSTRGGSLPGESNLPLVPFVGIMFGMSSRSSQDRVRPLIAIFLAIGVISSGFSRPLVAGAEAAVGTSLATSAPRTCCCGLDGSCGMGCCVLRAPVVPEAPIPASPSSERPSSSFVLVCQTELLSPEPPSVPRMADFEQADEQRFETSLQTLQVRLDI